jgi:hypothetical protein
MFRLARMPLTHASTGSVLSALLCLSLFFTAGLSIPARARETPAPLPASARLAGGFLQFNPGIRRMERADWRRILGRMVDAGMDTVVIQRLAFNDPAGLESYILPRRPGVEPTTPEELSEDDPTHAILEFAAEPAHRMQVYLGLWMDNDRNWSYDTPLGAAQSLRAYLHATAAKNTALAERAWKLYHGHSSFAGWYVPHELWNFPFGDPKQQPERKGKAAALRDFLHEITTACRALDAKDGRTRTVALSPYFNPDLFEPYAGPKVMAEDYAEILQPGAGIGLVMLQDGVGERQLTSATLKAKIAPYFEVFRKLAGEPPRKLTLWANAESFQREGDLRSPAPWERFRTQLEIEGPWVERLVTFDFLHYMNPDGDLHRGDASYVAAEKKLYEEYRARRG